MCLEWTWQTEAQLYPNTIQIHALLFTMLSIVTGCLVKRRRIFSLLLSENDSPQNVLLYQWRFVIRVDSLCKSISEKLNVSPTHTHTHAQSEVLREVCQRKAEREWGRDKVQMKKRMNRFGCLEQRGWTSQSESWIQIITSHETSKWQKDTLWYSLYAYMWWLICRNTYIKFFDKYKSNCQYYYYITQSIPET